MIYQSRQQTRRFEVLLKVVLGSNHPVPMQLAVYNNQVLLSESKLHLLQASHLLLPTMLCKRFAVSCSNWFCLQTTSPAPVCACDFSEVFTHIDNKTQWQPIMLPTFFAALRLNTFHQSTPLPHPAPTPPPRGTPASPTRVTPSSDPGQRNNNLQFNTAMFRTYKDSDTPCCTDSTSAFKEVECQCTLLTDVCFTWL